MKLSCSHCGQVSADGHLWCQQIDCPAGNVPTTFTFGEYLGDIQITRLLRIFRTAAIYEGKRGDTPILIKVSHTAYSDTLKQEADILARISGHNSPALPVLMPPYEGADIKRLPYGKAVFRGQLHYYLLFEYQQGVFLRDVLYENPEPWYRHAAWITIIISRALSYLHGNAQILHLNINPDVILVNFDEKTRIPNALLLDLGVMIGGNQVPNPSPDRYARMLQHIPPSYVAPEILKRDKITNSTDVYGIGMLLYEMLAGQPAYPFALRSAPEIHEAISTRKDRPPLLKRQDVPDPKKVEEILSKSIHTNHTWRYEGVTELRNDLIKVFGDIPIIEKPWYRDRQRLVSGAILVSSFVGVIFLFALLIAAFLE